MAFSDFQTEIVLKSQLIRDVGDIKSENIRQIVNVNYSITEIPIDKKKKKKMEHSFGIIGFCREKSIFENGDFQIVWNSGFLFVFF